MKTLDREEKQILSAFEAGTLKSTVTSEASLRRDREYARAAEEGIPYQTLIASVLHKFVQQGLVVGNDAFQEEIGNRVGRRLKMETRGRSKRADRIAEITL